MEPIQLYSPMCGVLIGKLEWYFGLSPKFVPGYHFVPDNLDRLSPQTLKFVLEQIRVSNLAAAARKQK